MQMAVDANVFSRKYSPSANCQASSKNNQKLCKNINVPA
jgi:hypothetical protein